MAAARATSLTVNGATRRIDADADMPLLWVLRDLLRLRGTKYGCGVGVCGVCTVLVDGRPSRSCMVPVGRVGGLPVTTIEGVLRDPLHDGLICSWLEHRVPQCGYCQPGQIVTAAALLQTGSAPADEEIAAAMNHVLCRCGTYGRIGRAIRDARRDRIGRMPRQHARAPFYLDAPEGIALNDWVRVRLDNTVCVVLGFSEMGQGVATALPMLVAEELEVDLADVRVAFAPADERYVNALLGKQATGGSTAVRAAWQPLRLAGAHARERLVGAAMDVWNVSRKECRAERGHVVHEPSGRRLAYAGLAGAAASLPEPRAPRLKKPSDFRLIGRREPRLDAPDLLAGTVPYGIDDATVGGMAVAVVSRAPFAGARVRRFTADGALATPGVRGVVEFDAGVAVLASDFWSAVRGRENLSVEWEGRSDARTAAIYESLDEALEREGELAERRGDAERALVSARRLVEARYRTPYLAHCTLEPMNCIADVRPDGCDIRVGTQDQSEAQRVATEITGLPASRINVHTAFLGGGFGRRLAADFVREAVQLSAATSGPVQVVWTRDDDLQHDRYRPAHSVALKASLDRDGLPAAWWQRIAGPGSALGMNDVPYAVADFTEEHVTVPSVVPVGAWRGVGATQNAFAVECFVDELAHHAGRDPLDYRLALLRHAPRHADVLSLAAERAGWGGPARGGRGVAVYESFGSCVAEVAEVSVGPGNAIRVDRVVCAVDCGQTVNPDILCAQLEGGIAFGLSAALKEEVRIDAGRVQQTNFEDYPILTFAEMPEVEVHVVDSAHPPGGIGEPGVPVIAPAVANAVFAATGERLRALPLRLPSPG